jgi:hypothetical protein
MGMDRRQVEIMPDAHPDAEAYAHGQAQGRGGKEEKWQANHGPAPPVGVRRAF